MRVLVHLAVLPFQEIVDLVLAQAVLVAEDSQESLKFILVDLLSELLASLGLNLAEVLLLDSSFFLVPRVA